MIYLKDLQVGSHLLWIGNNFNILDEVIDINLDTKIITTVNRKFLDKNDEDITGKRHFNTLTWSFPDGVMEVDYYVHADAYFLRQDMKEVFNAEEGGH